MYSKKDFSRFKWLPDSWWYYLNEHGEGNAVDFPIKIKAVLSWSPAHFIKKVQLFCSPLRVFKNNPCNFLKDLKRVVIPLSLS